MKLIIKNENEVYIPESKITVVKYKNIKEEFIDNMTKYTLGKRISGNLYDDNNDLISNKDLKFFYINPILLENEINTSKKSAIKEYLTNIILENDKLFLSIHKSLEDLQDVYTDQGFMRIIKKLSIGMTQELEVTKENFTVENFISMIGFVTSHLNEENKTIFLMNIIKEIYKDRYIVIYLSDIKITQTIIDYMNTDHQRISYLIDINCINNVEIFDQTIIKLLIHNHYGPVFSLDKDITLTSQYLYSFLTQTLNNYNFQQEKTKKIIQEFLNIKENFMIDFSTLHSKTL